MYGAGRVGGCMVVLGLGLLTAINKIIVRNYYQDLSFKYDELLRKRNTHDISKHNFTLQFQVLFIIIRCLAKLIRTVIFQSPFC